MKIYFYKYYYLKKKKKYSPLFGSAAAAVVKCEASTVTPKTIYKPISVSPFK